VKRESLAVDARRHAAKLLMMAPSHGSLEPDRSYRSGYENRCNRTERWSKELNSCDLLFTQHL